MKIPFEDLHWLFTCGSASRNICRLNLEEAVHLYKTIKSKHNPKCVEIGRYHGGSTMLMLAAGGDVITIDNHSKASGLQEYDDLVLAWSDEHGFAQKLDLVVSDSDKYDTSNLSIDVLFIDGGHSYEIVNQDFAKWFPCLSTGGTILFHDTVIPGVKKVIDEQLFLLKNVVEVSTLLCGEKI